MQRCLKVWCERDTFRQAWTQLTPKYERLHGINGEQILRLSANMYWLRCQLYF